MKVTDRLNYIAESKITYSLEQTKQLVRAEITGHMKYGDDPDAARILFLIGSHGEAKTRGLQQVAKEMKLAYASFHAGAIDSQDNTGLQQVIDGVTVHRDPAHMPIFKRPNSESGFGLFVIEEFGSNDNNEFQNQARQIAEGQLGGLKKHPGWILAATSNPESDEYLTVNKLDAALVSRLVIIPVKMTDDEKLTYWRTKPGQTMFDKLYWFLVMNRSFIGATDARTWYNLGKSLRNNADSGLASELDYRSVVMSTNKEIAAAFEIYQQKGNDPDQYPISGEALLHANSEDLRILINRLEKWLDNPEKCGILIQATKHDICVRIRETPLDVANEKYENLAAFIELVGGNQFTDQVYDLDKTLQKYRPQLQNRIVNNLGGTKVGDRLLELSGLASDTEERHKKIREANKEKEKEKEEEVTSNA